VIRVAGIIFLTRDKRVMLLRQATSGKWIIPAGTLEDGETAEDAALHYTWEQTGVDYSGKLNRFTLEMFDGVEFETYIARTAEWQPLLSEKHTAVKWVSIEDALKMHLRREIRTPLEALDPG
jgi:8-oxo-dGTP pyrophosphatase MutT (NUDIX family)